MKIGDRISVVDEDLEGTVISVDDNLVTFTTLDGFDMQFDISQLVVLNDQMHGLVIDQSKIAEKDSESKPRRTSKRGKKGSQVILEIDLHAEQLTKDYKRMPAHEILELQLSTAKRQLEFAIRNRIPKLVFIHGVGAGVLRTELEYLLRRYDHLKYGDADYQKYGMGALEVYFIQNKR